MHKDLFCSYLLLKSDLDFWIRLGEIAVTIDDARNDENNDAVVAVVDATIDDKRDDENNDAVVAVVSVALVVAY